MRYFYAAALLTFLSSCSQPPQLNLKLNAPGISNGVVILKQNNEQILSEPLHNGTYELKRRLETPGYYTLTVIDNDKPISDKSPYDVYLENADLTLNIDATAPAKYPAVTTTSSTEKQLAAYYTLLYKKTVQLDRQIDSLTRYLASSAAAALPSKKRAALYTSTRELQKDRRGLELQALQEFVAADPKATVGAHIMAQQYFVEDPKAYAAIFDKFTPEVKTSDDGLKISNKLGPVLKLFGGANAAEIIGQLPDGKPFDRKKLHNKITLVEFWKPDNNASLLIHQRIVPSMILTPADRAKFGVVSISIGDNAEAWKKAIKADHTAWVQVSDNKGDASPNVTAWNVRSVPAYFLVNEDWKMIRANVPFEEIDTEVHEYLKKKF